MEKTSKDWVPVGGSGRVMIKDTPLHKLIRDTGKEYPELMKDLASGGLRRIWFDFCKTSGEMYEKGR